MKPRFDPSTSKSVSFRARNPEFFQVAKPQNVTQATAITVRQPKRKISDLERRWGEKLHQAYPNAQIYPQFPLSLGTGCNYYVDFLIVTRTSMAWTIRADEVKGWRRETGLAKLKIAARIYPWIRFYLVTRGPAGWIERLVEP